MVKTVVGRNATILILTLGLVCIKKVFMKDKDEHTSTTCENEVVNLECPLYHGLKIMDAFWGRKSRKKCPAIFLNKLSTTTSSKQKNKTDTVLCIKGIDQEGILWRIRQICENMGTCAIPANSDFFGVKDPCPNVYKYLELTVKCWKYDLETWVGDNVYY